MKMTMMKGGAGKAKKAKIISPKATSAKKLKPKTAAK